MPFTKDQAKARLPLMLKRVALSAIDLVMKLDHYSVTSREVETCIMALEGYLAHTFKLYMTVVKAEVNEKLMAERMQKG